MSNSAESADNNYVNITIYNPIDNMTDFPEWMEARYDATFPSPVLIDPRKYYASIVRFSLPINCVPLTIFPLDTQTGQTNPNYSNLIIGITLSGTDYKQHVMYNPTNNLAPPTPMPNFSFSQASSPYYFIYSINQFLAMINTALAAAFVAAGSPGGGSAPYYIYNPNNQLFSIIVTSAFLGSGATIFLNAALQVYFTSFPFTTQNDPNNGPFKFYHDFTTLPFGGSSPYQFEQEYISVNLWLDARHIFLTTNSIPVSTESSPAITPPSFNQNGLDNALPIISDYVLAFNNISDIAGIITYVPSGQYRLTDLLSSGQLNRIQLQFFWLSENGIQQPLYLSPGSSASIKIGFFKKELYKHV